MLLYLVIVVVATVGSAALAAYGTYAGTQRSATRRERCSVPARTHVAGGYAVRVRTCRDLGGRPVGSRS
ncbi:hypothetical protein J2W56_000050 [Nocardia kruczakiae]|uniref:Secreted protein n=1 Tax=Nocardia kruczakiae TaxID=261477 RepID=A0ABU1X8I0_9NOCA|nr:hypothetical protein [Nocardia kruczakiae]